MNTTQILTDIENNIGKIYLLSNRTHGYYTLLPLVEENFLSFLEKLYSDIEVDDYEISYKYLLEANLKNKIISYLHNIFKLNTLTFAINNKINTSNDFFLYLDKLLVNHIRNNELLKNFTLFEQDITQYEKQNISSLLKNEDEKQNIVKKEVETKTEDKDMILPYNDYESLEINTEDIISPSLDNIILSEQSMQYAPWKIDDPIKASTSIDEPVRASASIDEPVRASTSKDALNKNTDNFNKCAILYCISQSIGIVIENQNIIFIEYLTKNFKDFELVKTYSKLDKKELDNIKNYFHKRNFENNETIFKKINSFEFLFDINNNNKNDIVYNEIEKFIRERYKIDNESKNMIKANEILGQLMLELQYFNKDKMKLTKELSSILLNMGIKKKRMADGIYYCGIISKSNLFFSSLGNIEEMFKKSVEEHKLQSLSEIMETLKINSANL